MTDVEVELYDDTRDAPRWIAVMGAAWQLATRLERAKEFVPEGFQGRAEAIMATIIAGDELGMPPLWSLRNMQVIKGNVTLKAQAMRALVLREGHELRCVKSTDDAVAYAGRRKGDQSDPLVIEWTMARAETAGLLDRNDTYRKYPRAMLGARATSELCGILFPDVIAGITTDVEATDFDDPFARDNAAGVAGNGAPASVRRRRRPSPTSAADAVPPTAVPPAADSRAPVDDDDPQQAGFGDGDPPTEADARAVIDDAFGDLLDVDDSQARLPIDDTPDDTPASVVVDDERRVRAKLFAELAKALPEMSRHEREHYRHALIALVTRGRPNGPSVHFGETDDVERQEMAGLLAELRAGRLLAAVDADGLVMFSSRTRQASVDLSQQPPTVTTRDR